MRGIRSAKSDTHVLRRTITRLVSNVYPGCHAEFVGVETGAGPRTGRFGFSIVDGKGKQRSQVIWLNPSFFRRCNKAWLRREVKWSRALL